MQTNIHFLSYLAHFFLEWEIFESTVVEEIKTHFMFSNFFKKLCHLWENVEKFCRVGQATNDSVAHASWINEYSFVSTQLLLS